MEHIEQLVAHPSGKYALIVLDVYEVSSHVNSSAAFLPSPGSDRDPAAYGYAWCSHGPDVNG